MAQTALGIQIRNLEEELGVPLLDRHSRGVTATAGGEVLNRYAADILALVQQARDSVGKLARDDRVDLALGITPSIMRLVGDAILIELAQIIPGVHLHVVEEFSFVLTRLLRQGEIACALTFGLDDDDSFSRRALLEEDLFYITSPLRAPATETVTFKQVLANDLVLTGEQDVVSRTIKAMARRLGLPLTVTYEVQSIRAVKNLAAKGIAASVMPYGAAEGELRSGVLAAKLIVRPNVVRTLMFVHRRDRAAVIESDAFQRFIDAIADRLHAAKGPVTRRL